MNHYVFMTKRTRLHACVDQLDFEGREVGVASQHELQVVHGACSDTLSREVPQGRVLAEGCCVPPSVSWPDT